MEKHPQFGFHTLETRTNVFFEIVPIVERLFLAIKPKEYF